MSLNISESLLNEKWSWVDHRLEELYYGYALTIENSDEYSAAGLLTEKWSWVVYDLENQYNDEDELRILCPAPINWVNSEKINTINDNNILEQYNRSRAESDISDHSETVDRVINKLSCESPLSCSSKRFGSLDSDTDDDPYYDCDGYDSF